MRSRDLGIVIGRRRPGPGNAITDVAGVRVGHTTLVSGDGPLAVGHGPVRTGVTVVVPHDGDPWAEPVFAGAHRLNGNGELTGLEWIREAGQLGGVVGLTNTHSVGVVHDALIAAAYRAVPDGAPSWSLPVVGETWDGALNDTNGFHVRPEHVDAAIAAATSGPVAEGGVGGGTGMVCHEFKGGIGTSSRVTEADEGGWTVGALVQANYGQRTWLRVDGVRVGEAIPTTDLPSPYDQADAIAAGARGRRRGHAPPGGLDHRAARDRRPAPAEPVRAPRPAGRARAGAGRRHGRELLGRPLPRLATGNRGLPGFAGTDRRDAVDVRMVADRAIDPLFEAAIEATEEAIVNALVAATTMTGRDGITAHALPHDRLQEAMARAGRLRPAATDRG